MAGIKLQTLTSAEIYAEYRKYWNIDGVCTFSTIILEDS